MASLDSRHKSRQRRQRPQRRQRRSLSNHSASPTFKKFRLVWVGLILLIAVLLLAARLYYLQIIKGPELLQKAKQQQIITLNPYIPRRQIVDKDNNLLATDRFVYTLYAHPKYFKEEGSQIAEKLSNIVKIPATELTTLFQQRETGIPIAHRLPEPVADEIFALSLDGLELVESYARYYPQDKMIAEIVGYVDQEHQGQAGLELSEQSLLKRNFTSENIPIRRTGKGTMIPTEIPSGLIKLDDLRLQLTINLPLQRAAREALAKQMTRYNAKRGTVIVMDVNDGSILALVCEPTYDPNQYYKYPINLYKNWAVSDLYEPGSTFKPLNIAIALEAGVITPNTTIYDTGKIKIDNWEVRNHDYATEGAHGVLTIPQILQKSSNVAMIEIMQRIPPTDYYQSLKKLGLREKLGVDLPGDTPGYLKSQVEFLVSPIESATAAFGQGFSLTPLKLTQLHGALANGGKLVTPHVLKGLVDSERKTHWQPSYSSQQVFDPETTKIVLKMMETVVEDGSGKPSQIHGYRIAGKTGTSQKAVRGGYDTQAKITSFVGIIPVDNPHYVVLAVVDEPKGPNTFGSTVAAPIVRSVMESLIALQGVPPSE